MRTATVSARYARIGVVPGPDGLIPSWNGIPLAPLTGGYSGETFLVGEPDDPAASVLRIYGRAPQRCAVDTALLRLVRGILPVPEVVESRPADAEMPGILVTERLPGVRLDHVLDDPATDDDARRRLGESVGRLLARLSGIPMPEPGFFADATLVVVRGSLDVDLDDFVSEQRDTSRLASWSDHDTAALRRLADHAQTLMEARPDAADPATYGRCVLVHSDFNPKNLLVDPVTGQVTGLLDWEFAHAGSPYHDLGNMLRFRRDPVFTGTLVRAYVDAAPPLRPDPVTLGRCQDLWALVELAGRSERHRVTDAATTLLRHCAREGDVNAWPWTGHDVPPGEGPL